MKRIIVFSMLCLLSAGANAQLLQHKASEFDLKASLVMDGKWVPYPEYSDRAGWDMLLGEYSDSLIRQGEKYMDFDWRVLRATDYLEYNRSGNRYTQEDRLYENAEALSRMMIAELAEGKGRFLDDIINGVFLFCQQTSWACSDHLYKFQLSRSPLPDHKDNMMALLQGNIAQMLSWAYYFFHNEFDRQDPIISERLSYEIRRQELVPFITRNDFDWMGLKPGDRPNNWNPWCNSNALLCYMLIENDRESLYAGVHKAILSLDKYLACIPSDGACDEGTVYWYKSAGNLYLCLRCLEMITGGQLNVWDNPLIRHFGEFVIDANIQGIWQANFADAKPTVYPSVPFIYMYGKSVGSALMTDYAVHYNALASYDPVDLDWSLFYRSIECLIAYKEVKKMPDNGFKPSDFVSYPVTELCYMRSGKGYLAAKGGNNKERHNHNDVGTCIYFYNGIPVLIDAGPGTYNKSTFDKRFRYKIWNMSSDYHNVPNINGFAQSYGINYKACGTEADKRRRTFTTDIAGAYPDSAAVKSWKREYKLGTDGSLQISDKFELTSFRAAPELHFLVPSKPVISAGQIKLNGGVSLHYNSSDFEASYNSIPLEGTGVSTVYGDTLYRLVLKYRDTTCKNSSVIKIW